MRVLLYTQPTSPGGFNAAARVQLLAYEKNGGRLFPGYVDAFVKTMALGFF